MGSENFHDKAESIYSGIFLFEATMKIITDEEKRAHIAHITAEGAKGLVVGGMLSAGMFVYFKKRMPVRFNSWNTSIKTCVLTMPTIGMGAFYADQGSWEFDKEMHHSEHTQAKLLEEYRHWNRLSTGEKMFSGLNNNKYTIIVSAWAASLYASWVIVNRDKYMTIAQKAVQARMYAQGITIILLLGTILLAIKDEEINRKKPAELPEWKKVLLKKEAEDAEIMKELQAKKEMVEAAEEAATRSD